MQHSIPYLLNRFTRTNEFPSWEHVDAVDLAVWRKAVWLLHTRRYTHQGCDIEVSANWRPALSQLEIHAEINKTYHQKLSRGEPIGDLFSGLLKKNDSVEIHVKISDENKFNSYRWYPIFFAEKYLYDFFCIMNLSVPGSCDFLNLQHLKDEKTSGRRLHLSSYNFEEAHYQALEEQSPYAKEIDIESVLSWYDGLGLGVKQIAETPIEKSLFSMLHFCKLDGDLVSVMWIFHALESIYSTRVGEGFSNLVSRISLLLKLDDEATKEMKKNLRELYDHRSSIIHGGYKVHYPMDWSAVDEKIDANLSKNYRLLQFGFDLILASIQALIINRWYGISVAETLTGIEDPNIPL